MTCTVGKGGASLFVLMLAVNHQTVPLLSELLSAVPYFRDKGTGRVVAIGINSLIFEPVLDFQGCAKGRYDDNIFFSEGIQRDFFGSIGFKQKPDPPFLQ